MLGDCHGEIGCHGGRILFACAVFYNLFARLRKQVAERGHCEQLTLREQFIPMRDSISAAAYQRRRVWHFLLWFPLWFRPMRRANLLFCRCEVLGSRSIFNDNRSHDGTHPPCFCLFLHTVRICVRSASDADCAFSTGGTFVWEHRGKAAWVVLDGEMDALCFLVCEGACPADASFFRCGLEGFQERHVDAAGGVGAGGRFLSRAMRRRSLRVRRAVSLLGNDVRFFRRRGLGAAVRSGGCRWRALFRPIILQKYYPPPPIFS